MKRALPALLFALLVVAVYADPLFVRRMFAGRDLVAYHLPVESAIHDAYARGRLPVWISEISGGRPLLPNPNAGALYPVRPLLGLVGFSAAMRLFPVLHWILSGFGMILLLRSLGASRAAAWIGAVTYVFSGVGVSSNFYTNLHPGVALLPWIVWAVRLDAAVPRKAALLGLLFGLDALAGDVFTTGLALAAALLWILLEIEPRNRRREAGALTGGLGLAALLALPQIVATALWVPETNRAVVGMKIGEVVRFSISPIRLLEFVVPYPFGPTWTADATRLWASPIYHFKSLGFYATFFAGALAVIGLVSTWRERSGGARFGRVFLLFCAALSVPPSLLTGGWLQRTSPIPLRFPEKFAVGLVFAVALLAGVAVDRVRRGARPPRWPLAVAGALTLIAWSATAWPERAGAFAVRWIGADSGLAARAADSLGPSFAEGGVWWAGSIVGLELLRGRGRLRAVSGLLLLSGAVVGPNRRIAQTFSEEQILPPTAFARHMARRDPAGQFRTFDESLFSPPSALDASAAGSDAGAIDSMRRCWYYDTQTLWGLSTVLNYDFDKGDLSRLESLRRLAARAAVFRDSGDFFGALALKWGVRYRDQPPLAGFRRFGGDALQDWDENPNALPDIRVVERWREAPGPREALAALPTLARGEIVIETGASAAGSARPGRVSVLERSPERLLLLTSASDPAWLFVLRDCWSYRTVLLDGRPVEFAPAQLAFSAVALPAGEHRVEWIEEVPGGRVSVVGPPLFLLAVAWISLKKGKPSP
jgi:hypothetical protein